MLLIYFISSSKSPPIAAPEVNSLFPVYALYIYLDKTKYFKKTTSF